MADSAEAMPESERPDEGTSRVSVVVTIQNEAPGLERTLAGLDRQGDLLEVIVVDRGSIDHGIASARRWGASVIEAGPVTAAEARNLGLQRASGEAVLFLDARSIPCPGWARALAGPIIDGKTLVTKGGQRTRQSAASARLLHLFHERRWQQRDGALTLLDDYCIGVARQEFIQYGGFSPDSPGLAIEDQKTARLICDSGRALFVPQAVIERHYEENWSVYLGMVHRNGLQKGRLLRLARARFMAGLSWSLHDMAQIPLVFLATVLVLAGLFSPAHLFLAFLATLAPAISQLLLLKRGVDQFSPDFFFAAVPLVIARAWCLTVGCVRGMLPERKPRAVQQATPMPAPGVTAEQPFGAAPPQPPAAGGVPQAAAGPPAAAAQVPGSNAIRKSERFIDPASAVQRKQSPAGAAFPQPSSEPLRTPEEDRELDFTP